MIVDERQQHRAARRRAGQNRAVQPVAGPSARTFNPARARCVCNVRNNATTVTIPPSGPVVDQAATERIAAGAVATNANNPGLTTTEVTAAQ